MIQEIIKASGGTFNGLEPAMQALLQAAAERVVYCPSDTRQRVAPAVMLGAALSPAAVSVSKSVPLLLADSYSHLLGGVLGALCVLQLARKGASLRTPASSGTVITCRTLQPFDLQASLGAAQKGIATKSHWHGACAGHFVTLLLRCVLLYV
jgi:hypothetical protein